jgi:hypothetical protein
MSACGVLYCCTLTSRINAAAWACSYHSQPAFAAGLLEEQHLMGQPDTVVWYPNGKYVVFPRQVRFARW